MKQSYIAWVSFQRRILSMQSYFGYETMCVSFVLKSRSLKLLEYLVKIKQTIELLLQQRPQIIWIQLPPSPLLYLTFLYKVLNGKILKRQVQLIADCHNATFRAPWIKSPFVIQCINYCDLVLVHNEMVKKQALELGVTADRLVVLQDRTSLITSTSLPRHSFKHPWILIPCSFGADEPISEILMAATVVPEITFVITGNTGRAKGKHDLSQAPANVQFTGFLPKGEFDALLCQADAVLGLTKLDGIQLSAAVEAVSAGKPAILSDTALLKSLFYQGAAYVDPFNPEDIASGCKHVLTHRVQLRQEVTELKDKIDTQWLLQANKISQFLGLT